MYQVLQLEEYIHQKDGGGEAMFHSFAFQQTLLSSGGKDERGKDSCATAAANSELTLLFVSIHNWWAAWNTAPSIF